MLKSVRFLAEWFDTDEDDYRIAETIFTLGPGPCGKNVVRLETAIAEGCLTVSQTCSDGECKFFTYPMSQIAGRIEMTEMTPIQGSGNVVPFPKG